MKPAKILGHRDDYRKQQTTWFKVVLGEFKAGKDMHRVYRV